MNTYLSSKQHDRIAYLLNDEWVSDTGSPEDDERISLEKFSIVLRKMSAIEIHHFAINFNWDCGIEELTQVIKHPLCDSGTALLIYWLGQPDYYLRYSREEEVPHNEFENFQLLKMIESKYLSDEFATNQICVNPSNIDGHNFSKMSDEKREMIPEKLFLPSMGALVERIDFF